MKLSNGERVRCDVCRGEFLETDVLLVHTCSDCDDSVIVHAGLCDTILHARDDLVIEHRAS